MEAREGRPTPAGRWGQASGGDTRHRPRGHISGGYVRESIPLATVVRGFQGATDIHALKVPVLEMETGLWGPRTGAEGDLNRARGGWWRFYQGKTHEQMGSSWPVAPRVQ